MWALVRRRLRRFGSELRGERDGRDRSYISSLVFASLAMVLVRERERG